MLLSRMLPLLLLTSCVVGEDEATDGTAGVSVTTIDRGLTGCRGVASRTVPADGRYFITTFGGPGDHQPMSCGGYANGTTWYAASRQRYGCGAKLRIEANGRCVVAEALDYGPDVCVENAAGQEIMDVSPKISRALFDEAGAGYSDRMTVHVEEVAAATPVGPCASTSPDAPDAPDAPGAGTCASATLDRDVADGTCVQAADDGAWYACNAGAWQARSSAAGCATAYGFCESATLGEAVPPRTCVQAASNRVWYQCNGQGWVSPIDVGERSGPLGACAAMHAL